jgi:uncharacterized membrane protein (UPF0127 family)
MRIPIAILSAVSLAACGTKSPEKTPDLFATEVIFPNGTKIIAQPARTQLEILQGLRYYDNLPADRGMLFIYPQPDKHAFWTYGAKFPVDIVWMDRDRRIVEMSLDTKPCLSKSANECPTFGVRDDSRYVLEVRAGVASQNGLRIGDRLDF